MTGFWDGTRKEEWTMIGFWCEGCSLFFLFTVGSEESSGEDGLRPSRMEIASYREM